MRETYKALLGFVFTVCFCLALFGGIFWILDHSSTARTFCLIGTVLGTLSLVVLITAVRRKDKAPDFLGCLFKNYLEREGLCFAIQPRIVNGRLVAEVLFQNRYAGSCTGMLFIRPKGEASDEAQRLAIAIDAPGGGFGVVHVPWNITPDCVGRRQTLLLTARSVYPSGRGQLLRFTDGRNIPAAGHEDLDTLHGITESLTGLSGSPVAMKIEINWPTCAPIGGDDSPTKTRSATLWTCMDPPDLMLGINRYRQIHERTLPLTQGTSD